MSNKILHYQSDNKNDNYAYARCYVEPFKPIDKLKQIGDGTFDLIMKQETSYEGLVKLGTLCDETGEEYPLPVKPWTPIPNPLFDENSVGDIPIYNGNKKYIGNTSKNPENVLQWHKFLDKDKYIYICDRCILTNIHVRKLYDIGLINKIIKIDNKYFLCRLLTKSEFFKYIYNDNSIQNILSIEQYSKQYICKYIFENFENNRKYINTQNIECDLNNLWNYYGIYTMCYEDNVTYCCGCYSIGEYILGKYIDIYNAGWRPVLEEIEFNFLNDIANNDYNVSEQVINLKKIKDIEFNKKIRTL